MSSLQAVALAAVLLATATATACGRPGTGPDRDPVTTPAAPPSLPAAVAAAVTDLAGRLGVRQEEVEIVSFHPVTWSDGSLGCPEPGRMYTQALVDGHRLVLAARGTEHAYHGGADGRLAYCPHPRPPAQVRESA